MDFRSCGLEIYKYDKKYIFFGALKLYIEMYKSIMPGVFSEPILAIKEDCSIEEMSEAILKSIEILHENKDKIAEESNRIKYGDLLSLRFKKLNKVGIRASKKRVVEGGHISVIPSFEDNIIYILKAESESSYEEIELPINTPVEKIAEIIKREL